MDSHYLAWSIDSGMLDFGVALSVGVMDFHASMWPFELRIRTLALWRCCLIRGYGLPDFGVAL